ncbi:hypothetical protein [Vibrio misgurnus]|uniref:hypothetical protein n=1 Tax=Vibrio misgurnus TaxID=2993714 RepID=UPI0023F94FC2|nr:hypothetical protein [Vibrio sp. VCS]
MFTNKTASLDIETKATTTINYDYEHIGSGPVNEHLRNGESQSLLNIFGSKGEQIVAEMIDKLESGRLEGSARSFFRIASDDQSVLTNANIGDVFFDKGLISAGTNKSQMLKSDFYQEITGASDSKPVVITITGNPAIVTKGGTFEAIFPPNSKLMVEEKAFVIDKATGIAVLHISLVEKFNHTGICKDIYNS